jgi:hypothetical protein
MILKYKINSLTALRNGMILLHSLLKILLEKKNEPPEATESAFGTINTAFRQPQDKIVAQTVYGMLQLQVDNAKSNI